MIRTLSAYARAQAQAHPEREAVRGDGHSLTYAALLADACALAASLQKLGIQKGEVLSFQLPNWIEACVINLAADLIGAIVSPIVPIYREGELLAMLGESQSRCLFVPSVWNGFDYAAVAARLQRSLPTLRTVVRVRCQHAASLNYDLLIAKGRDLPVTTFAHSPDDRKLLLFTSGTTGRAKGVIHSQASLTAPLLRAAREWGLKEGSCVLMPSPVTHVTGYCCGLEMPLFLGTRTVLMERWNGARAVQLIDAEHANTTIGATPFLKELLDAAEAAGSRLPSLALFACGGASVPPALIRRAAHQLSGRAFRVYGASEAPLVTFGCAASDPLEIAAETDGRINGYEVRVADAVASEGGCPEGEILVRGAGLTLGYLNSMDDADAFTPEGFFRTGDIGRIEKNALVITGRKKDLIIRGGEKISPGEVEDVLMRDPRICEAALVSMPHPRLGETGCLFAVLSAGAEVTLADVACILNDAGLARQKTPEHLVVVEQLPKTPSGKIRKDQLRQEALAQSCVRFL